jgi:hypothetical protein
MKPAHGLKQKRMQPESTRLPFLRPGPYRLVVEAAGFKRYVQLERFHFDLADGVDWRVVCVAAVAGHVGRSIEEQLVRLTLSSAHREA